MNRRNLLYSLGGLGIAGVTTSGVYRRAVTTPSDPVDVSPDGTVSNSSTSGPETQTPEATEPSAPEVLDDFEDVDDWHVCGGRLSRDRAEFHAGTQSARLDIGRGTNRGCISREFDRPVDLSGKHVSMTMKADGNVLPRVQLFDADGDRLGLRASVRGGLPFYRYDFGIEEGDDSFDPASVVKVRISEYAGDSSRTVWCDDLGVFDRPDTGKVMFQFDDGNVTDYTKALPVLEEYDYPAVTFVNPGSVGGEDQLTLEQLRQLRDAGWTVGSHAFDHVSLPDLETAAQETQLRKSKAWLRENGFERGADYFAYPYKNYDAETLSLVDEYYTLGFAGGYSGVGRVTDPYQIHRLGDLERSPAKTAIDRSVRWNGLTNLYFHWLDKDGLAEFEAIVDYVRELEAAGELDVISPAHLEDELLY